MTKFSHAFGLVMFVSTCLISTEILARARSFAPKFVPHGVPVAGTLAHHFSGSVFSHLHDEAIHIQQGELIFENDTIPAHRISALAPPNLWVAYADARTGELVAFFNATRRHQALVYDENPTTTPNLATVTLENIESSGPNANHTYGTYARAATCAGEGTFGCMNLEFNAVADSVDGFTSYLPTLGTADFTDGFSEVSAYYNVDRISNWFADEFGFDGQFMDMETYLTSGAQNPQVHLWITVNSDYDNGAFIPGALYGYYDAISLGAIGTADLAYDADVVMHEFTHGVSSKAFNIYPFGYDTFGSDLSTGAIEEGTADYFAASYNDNSSVGEFAGIQRDLQNHRECPTDMIGESHYDGRIFGGAMWAIRDSIGKNKTDHLLYRTLDTYPIRGFDDFGDALVQEAHNMAGSSSGLPSELQLSALDIDSIEQALEDRNITGCDRVIDLKSDDSSTLYMDTAVNYSQGTPSPIQYRATTGANTKVLSFKSQSMGSPEYDIFVREGQRVEYTWITEPFLHFEAVYDYDFLFEGTTLEKVDISNLSDPPLKPNTEYYFSVVARIEIGEHYQGLLTAELSDVPLQEPEDGPDSDAGVDGGNVDSGVNGSTGSDCGCSNLGAESYPALFKRLLLIS